MGSGSSYQMPDIGLVPLAKPATAISLRYCHEEHLTLQYKTKGFSSTLTFRNVHTNAVQFKLKELSMLSSRTTLLDGSDVAIANFRCKRFSSKPIYYVHLGREYDGDAALEIYADYHSGLKTQVRVSFTDLFTHEQCELSFEGHWRKRMAYFWLDRGNRGVREPVAKVFCPDGVSRSKFHVAIAPHMDVALITMVCAILAKQQSNQEQTTTTTTTTTTMTTVIAT